MSKLLDEADNLQQKTKKTLDKINYNINDIDNIASLTLQELRSNTKQIDDNINETNVIDKNLDISEKLKNKFNILNGNFFGFNIFKSKNKKCDTNKLNISNSVSNNTNNNIDNNNISKKNNNYTENNKNINNNKFNNVYVDNDNLANRLNKINNNDIEIDNSLDNISNSLDKIMVKSQLMKEEVIQQNNKLDILDHNLNNVKNKQDKLNNNIKDILHKK